MGESVFDYRAINARLRQRERASRGKASAAAHVAAETESATGRTVYRIYFGLGETGGSVQREIVERIGEIFRDRAVQSIEIHGHTDAAGSHGSNMRLGAERALSVKRALVSGGVDRDLIELFSHGPDRPCRGSGSSAENRRVEIVVNEDA